MSQSCCLRKLILVCNHDTFVVKRNQVSIGEVTVGDQLRSLFALHGEVNAWRAYQLLKQKPDFRGSYGWVVRLFYALKTIGLIRFSRQAPSSTRIPKRLYRAVPKLLDDPRWRTPYSELYPGSAAGGLKYIRGTSGGRRRKYAKR